MKIHRQFGHAHEKKLIQLINGSKINDSELIQCIKQVCKDCEICEKYKPAHLKPIVSLPIATEFNSLICLDLKEITGGKPKYILHMIDSATRYTAAHLIMNKKKKLLLVTCSICGLHIL